MKLNIDGTKCDWPISELLTGTAVQVTSNESYLNSSEVSIWWELLHIETKISHGTAVHF